MTRSKFVVPKYPQEQLLFGLVMILMVLYLVWEFGVILPAYHHRLSTVVVIHIFSAAFITVNIVANVLLIMRTDASGRSSYLPSVQQPGWRYCYDCKLCSPPRSYHCLDCDKCILKRNHHCMFTGCCIGYHNHRYYLVALAYMFVGAAYAVVYQWDYCLTHMGEGLASKFLSLLAPHFALLLGYISLHGFVISAINIVCMVISIRTGQLMFKQLKLIYRGQTEFELTHDVTNYNFGWKRNFQDVLGTKWFLVWLIPIVSSSLQGDGIKSAQEQVKSM